jgi:hypothetical protein
MVRLRVTNPFLALQDKDDKSTFCTLTVGEIIAAGDDLWQPGLVHISLRGQDLLAFARDIKEHTETIDLGVQTTEVGRSTEGEGKTKRPADRQPGKHKLKDSR